MPTEDQHIKEKLQYSALKNFQNTRNSHRNHEDHIVNKDSDDSDMKQER